MADLLYTDDLIQIVEKAKEECLFEDGVESPFLFGANHGVKAVASTILLLAARHDYELKYGESPYDDAGKDRMAEQP